MSSSAYLMRGHLSSREHESDEVLVFLWPVLSLDEVDERDSRSVRSFSVELALDERDGSISSRVSVAAVAAGAAECESLRLVAAGVEVGLVIGDKEGGEGLSWSLECSAGVCSRLLAPLLSVLLEAVAVTEGVAAS